MTKPMISAAYLRLMARYSAWQNRQLLEALEGVSDDVCALDRGAFFGSIHATLNHLLWADRAWLSRFSDRFDKPRTDVPHTEATSSMAQWREERAALDAEMVAWADGLSDADVAGDLSWYSMITKTEQTQPLDGLLVHFFNHQTHHRGQVHAMMTAAGLTAPVSDIPFMPKD